MLNPNCALPRGFGNPRAEPGDSDTSFSPKPIAAREALPSASQSSLSQAGDHRGQEKTPALNRGLTKGSCWGGFSALRGCFYAQVIGSSSRNLTSHIRGDQAKLFNIKLLVSGDSLKKEIQKCLKCHLQIFASRTLVFKYCVRESSLRAISCTI